ncbi:MAG: hypothetical protein CMH57_15955 [Myxococcales bacterium]|nr:hypothetical protein [Myxococcales bacterium]
MSRLESPAFPRNREPICAVLAEVFTEGERVLELASGPGQHVCYFAQRLPRVRWQPSDRDPRAIASTNAWREALGLEGQVASALPLDLDAGPWPDASFDGAVAINVFHMVGLDTIEQGLVGVAQVMRPGGRLVVYDCFTYDGEHVSESNARFDAMLRQRTRSGGVHAFEAVDAFAARVGLEEPVVHRLPANNQCVVWRRA